MKFFRTLARNILVQRFGYTHKEAVEIIASGRLLINGKPAGQQQEIHESDNVELDGKLILEGKKYFYIAYHKPPGVECTLNTNISDNLLEAIQLNEKFFPVGRLDKASEGLMLLTNDGFLCSDVIGNEHSQEKEYEVVVDRYISDEALQALASGVMVMGQLTKPAKVVRIGEKEFRIVLTQGLNRQIRRMCHKVGVEVVKLKRIRIVTLLLGELPLGEWKYLTTEELNTLKSSVTIEQN
jgi:23S rRNA pseudouridine2604 synthase